MIAASLPNDSIKLKELVIDYYVKLQLSNKELKKVKTENSILKEIRAALEYKIFGRKSEKWKDKDCKQARLFNEAETYSEEEDTSAKDSETKVKGYKRKKRARTTILNNLPVKKEFIDIPEDEKVKPCGCKLKLIGTEETRTLEIIPAQAYVKLIIRYKYSNECSCDEDVISPGVKIAPLPESIHQKSMATNSSLAFIIISKFVDGLPFYRVVKVLERFGVFITRATLCTWAVKVFIKLNRLLKLLWMEARKGPVIHLDETPLQVLNEPGRKNTTKSFMFVARGGVPQKPVIMFRYRRTRSAKFLKRLLKGYHGTILTDGYSAYENVAQSIGTDHAGCWSHARRKFVDFFKVVKKNNGAKKILKLIQKLYKIEKKAKNEKLSPDEVKALRQKESKPLIDELKIIFENKKIETNPKSLLGKAVNYALNQWPKLIIFLEDGSIPIDNNLVENALRPFVIGRKAWLFSGVPKGARASAGLYSIIETAKANKLEPYWYFRYLFDNILQAKSDEELKKLLPTNIPPEILKQYQENKMGLVS